jgi:hypothetical protein
MVILSLVALATLALPTGAGAGASAYGTVSRYYFNHGSIPLCRFASSTLQTALNEVGAYGEQYFADLTDAIQSTLQDQAAVRCVHGRAVFSIGAHHGNSSPPPRGLVAPSSPTAPTSAGPPAPIVLLGALAALAALVASLITFGRWRGWEPEWVARWEHAWAQAGYRFEALRERLSDLRRAG